MPGGGCCDDEVTAGAGAACVCTAAELGGGACETGLGDCAAGEEWDGGAGAGGLDGAGWGVEDGDVEAMLGEVVGLAGGDEGEVRRTTAMVVVLGGWTVTVVVRGIGELGG